MNRNRNDYFSNVPTPSLPRSKQDFGIHSRLQTQRHGMLTPFYCRLVYPDSNLKIDCNAFVRMDTSITVPLDNVYMDTYFFFVPLRIIDKNFAHILGDKTFYDTTQYIFPRMVLNGSMSKDVVLSYLGYGALNDSGTGAAATDCYWNHAGSLDYYNFFGGSGSEVINTYSLGAYYTIYNQFFRDNNLDPEIPVDNLMPQNSTCNMASLQANSLWNGLKCLPVNRYHDMFSSGLISPVNDGAAGQVNIPLGTSLVPVVTTSTEHTTVMKPAMKIRYASGTKPSSTTNLIQYQGTADFGASYSPSGSPSGWYPSNLYAAMGNLAGPSVQQLYTSLALYSLYDKRGTFGTRLIEQIRGQFGLEVPDGLLDRAEYLGGSCQTLNNVPVLNTASSLGDMSGNSATLTGLNSFDKFFNEWGFVIGVSTFRIKHRYAQAIVEPSLKMFDNLDMYWPSFANIGKVGIPNYRILHNPRKTQDTEIFNYNEPWIDQHTEVDYVAGEFGAFHSASTFTNMLHWTYQDIYDDFPVFSPTWLKEPTSNIERTLKGTLLDQTVADPHQYMVEYCYHVQLTMPIPTHSHAPNITGRL